jgi:rfaE bifunctional protein kinase chain/domain
MDDLAAILDLLAGQAVLVIGDLILDEYIVGAAARVSREAPVIIVEERRREWLIGGAAMPALNVRRLGGRAVQVGVVGPDDAGRQLLGLLREAGVDVAGVAVDPDRRTTTKTRIVAEGFLVFPQQVARVDRLDRHPLSPPVERAVLAQAARAAAGARALLVSDYKNGVVTPGVIAGARDLASRAGVLLAVDTQGDLDRFAGFDLVKCNHHDAAAFLGRPLDGEEQARAAIVEIQRRLGAPEIVITRAGEGVSFYSAAEGYGHLPPTNRTEVFDVTGAGDTVIAVLTLARAAGASLRAACRLANLAAGVVIRKRGNQPITREELADEVMRDA